MKKIYTDDPLVSYRTTTVSVERTRDEISMILRQYDVADIFWHWRPQDNDIFVQFGIEEVIDGVPVKVAAKVSCPIIWRKGVSRSRDPEKRDAHPDLKVSMRAMFWYIKTHLECAYAMQSSRVAGFLSDLVTPKGTVFFDEMKQNLDKFKALENQSSKTRNVEVIKPTSDSVIIDV